LGIFLLINVANNASVAKFAGLILNCPCPSRPGMAAESWQPAQSCWYWACPLRAKLPELLALEELLELELELELLEDEDLPEDDELLDEALPELLPELDELPELEVPSPLQAPSKLASSRVISKKCIRIKNLLIVRVGNSACCFEGQYEP
jgi:hypothetical protein